MENLLSRLFVLICMIVIALMVCLMSLSLFNLNLASAIAVGIVLFAAMIVLQSQAEMRRELRILKNRTLQFAEYRMNQNHESANADTGSDAITFKDYSADIAELRAKIAGFGERLKQIETDTDEIGETGGLPENTLLAQATVLAARTENNLSIDVGSTIPKAQPIRPASEAVNATADNDRAVETAKASKPDPTSSPQAADEAARPVADVLPFLRKKPAHASPLKLQTAIAKDNLNLHLQPIVTLSERRPGFYEAFMRLKQEDGSYLDAAEFVTLAEDNGLMSLIDKKVLFSSVRMLHKLAGLSQKMGLFCNLSPRSLSDSRGFREILILLETNISLRQFLVLQVSQKDYRSFDAVERERLSEIADLGFALSVDRVFDTNLDPRELRAQGFSYVRTPATHLLHAAPPDFSRLLGSHGIELIAANTDREDQILDLVARGVRLGQGDAFAPPRPVRSELLETPQDTTRQPEIEMARASGA